MDTTQSITKSAKRFFSGTMLSRLTGLGRDVAMGAAFGTHEAVAGFLVAFRLAHLMRRLLGEGALQTAFIPQFEKLRQQNPEKAGRFFRDLNIALTLLLSLLIVLSVAGLGVALFFGTFSPGNRSILLLTLLMMPSLLFICLFGLNASLLQCEKSYFIPSLAPVAFNGVWIAGVLCLWTYAPEEAMPYLALFIILACIAQWLFTLPKVVKIVRAMNIPRGFSTQELRHFCKPLFLGILGIAASQISNALDPLFARYADAEGPAFLWYAIRVQQLPLALFGIALSGALLPPLSRAAEAGDWPKFSHFLDTALRRGLALMFPITAAIFLMGVESINLLYGRGEFSDQSTFNTTFCLFGYGVGLIPMTLILFLAPAFYAQHNYRLPTIAALLAVALNLFLNTFFVAYLGWGSASIAWATSLSSWINFAFLAIALFKISGPYLSPQFWRETAKVIVTTLAAASLCLVIMSFLGSDLALYTLAQGISPSLPHSFSGQLLQLLFPSALFGLALLFFSWLWRTDDLLIFIKI